MCHTCSLTPSSTNYTGKTSFSYRWAVQVSEQEWLYELTQYTKLYIQTSDLVFALSLACTCYWKLIFKCPIKHVTVFCVAEFTYYNQLEVSFWFWHCYLQLRGFYMWVFVVFIFQYSVTLNFPLGLRYMSMLVLIYLVWLCAFCFMILLGLWWMLPFWFLSKFEVSLWLVHGDLYDWFFHSYWIRYIFWEEGVCVCRGSILCYFVCEWEKFNWSCILHFFLILPRICFMNIDGFYNNIYNWNSHCGFLSL